MKNRSVFTATWMLVIISIAGAGGWRGAAAQNNNPFVGRWEPVAEPGVTARLEYLQIKEDNTFFMKGKAERGRGDLNGTYTVKDGKLSLVAEVFKKHRDEPQGTIAEDGRLKLVMNHEDHGHYLVKK